MIKIVLSSVLVTVLAACSAQNAPSAQQGADNPSAAPGWSINPDGDLNGFFNCLEDEGITLVSAHRGGPYRGYPENSRQAIAAIMDQAPALFEIDVATSKDGVLYLLHDDTLDRTTTGSGPAHLWAWKDIAELKLVDNEGTTTSFAPSTLDETLALVKDRALLQIDFKRSTRYEDVVKAVNRQGAEDRVIYIAYSIASARKLHRLAPDAMISFSINSQSDLNRAVAAGIPSDRLLGFTGTDAPRSRLFSLLNDQEVEVIFGTLGGRQSIDRAIARIGDHDRYAEIAALGVDILATDRPVEAHKALINHGRGPKSGSCGITDHPAP